jgi:hypothetical protein
MTAPATGFLTGVDSIIVRGSTLQANARDALVRADFSTELDQVSQLTMQFLDPTFKVLGAGFFLPGTAVQFEDYRLDVASLEVGDIDGVEGFTVKARSASVRLLKDSRGALVVTNMSPSEYVANRCASFGIRSVVQSSERRPQIARDIPQPGQTYSEPPSDWTTFKRLAEEIGFVLFEVVDVVYFGKPSWLIANTPDEVIAAYKTGDERNWVNGVPQCVKSSDSIVTTVEVEFPTNYTGYARPGKRLQLQGVPLFNGAYLISGVSVDLLDPSANVSVSAETPTDPEPRPPETASGSSSGGGTVNITIPATFRTYRVGNVKPWVQSAVNEIGTIFGIKTIYGWAPGKYDHPKGLAADFMISNISNGKSVGDKIANWAIQHAARLGITYIIWYRRSWNPSRRTWVSYSGDSAHTDHIHLSFKSSHTYRRP